MRCLWFHLFPNVSIFRDSHKPAEVRHNFAHNSLIIWWLAKEIGFLLLFDGNKNEPEDMRLTNFYVTIAKTPENHPYHNGHNSKMRCFSGKNEGLLNFGHFKNVQNRKP